MTTTTKHSKMTAHDKVARRAECIEQRVAEMMTDLSAGLYADVSRALGYGPADGERFAALGTLPKGAKFRHGGMPPHVYPYLTTGRGWYAEGAKRWRSGTGALIIVPA